MNSVSEDKRPTDDQIVAKAITRSKEEIRFDVAEGRVPPDVRDFGTLHDYVDANCYGGLCDDEPSWEGWTAPPVDEDHTHAQELATRIQDAVHQWLQQGGLDGAPAPAPCVCGHAYVAHARATWACPVTDCDCTHYDAEKE